MNFVAPPRIAPLEAPHPPEVADHLRRAMPARAPVEPLALFRLWARHLPMAEALFALGSYNLGRGTLAPADREIVILRTCARLDAEYEWGVHAVSFPARLGIPEAVVAATRTAASDDPVWNERQALLVRLVDELCETARVGDALWAALAERWSDVQLLELLLVAGFYHVVAFTVNAVRLPNEAWAARFPAPAPSRS
jgi:alkylhydroperoxidase family enzyme